jgi:hypothetical protein
VVAWRNLIPGAYSHGRSFRKGNCGFVLRIPARNQRAIPTQFCEDLRPGGQQTLLR